MMKIKLHIPQGYFKSGCNGCGAGWNAKVVPDTIYGLSIEDACCIHDYMYAVGKDDNDKFEADHTFLDNMLIIIANHNKWYYPTYLARRRALSYYDAVARFGDKAFYGGKSDD